MRCGPGLTLLFHRLGQTAERAACPPQWQPEQATQLDDPPRRFGPMHPRPAATLTAAPARGRGLAAARQRPRPGLPAVAARPPRAAGSPPGCGWRTTGGTGSGRPRARQLRRASRQSSPARTARPRRADGRRPRAGSRTALPRVAPTTPVGRHPASHRDDPHTRRRSQPRPAKLPRAGAGDHRDGQAADGVLRRGGALTIRGLAGPAGGLASLRLGLGRRVDRDEIRRLLVLVIVAHDEWPFLHRHWVAMQDCGQDSPGQGRTTSRSRSR